MLINLKLKGKDVWYSVMCVFGCEREKERESERERERERQNGFLEPVISGSLTFSPHCQAVTSDCLEGEELLSKNMGKFSRKIPV